MKKVRLILGAFALVFAFATAFAFKTAPATVTPAYVLDGVCEPVSVVCNGSINPCQKDIGGGIIRPIFDKQSSSCPELKMN